MVPAAFLVVISSACLGKLVIFPMVKKHLIYRIFIWWTTFEKFNLNYSVYFNEKQNRRDNPGVKIRRDLGLWSHTWFSHFSLFLHSKRNVYPGPIISNSFPEKSRHICIIIRIRRLIYYVRVIVSFCCSRCDQVSFE